MSNKPPNISLGSRTLYNVSKRLVLPGSRPRAAGLGFCGGWPGLTVSHSPAFRAYLTGPIRTADTCRLANHLRVCSGIIRYLRESPDIPRHSPISPGTPRYLRASSDICGYRTFRYLGVFAGIRRFPLP